MILKVINIQMYTHAKGKILILVGFLIIGQIACKKFVEIPPPAGTITENSVYTSDATAISVLTYIYSTMNKFPVQGAFGSISLYAGLSADELALPPGSTNTTYLAYYENALIQIAASPASGAEHWVPLYNFIFRCNAAIEGLSASGSLTPLVKQQLLGEAKLLRALFYFYLVNEFGDLPLALTTDPKENTLLARSSQAKVYQQIISDLLDAKDKLSENYVDATLLNSTTERVRPTKWAAAALLARVYLYTGEYAKAEEQAGFVIGHTTLYRLLPSLNDVFLKNSQEAIWQIQPTAINFNTPDAQAWIIPATGPNGTSIPAYLSDQLLNSFEAGDLRAVYGNWMDTTIFRVSTNPLVMDTVAYPFKYKLNSIDATITTATGTKNMKEHFMVLRLGEQYLIMAEAKARQNKIAESKADLDAIRKRAGLPNTNAGDQSSLLTAILHERQVELFCELGHRWFDLKRTEAIDAVMSVVTPQKSNGASTWQSYKRLFPIALTELEKAPNLVQNQGY